MFKAGEINQIVLTAFADKAEQDLLSLIFGIFNEDMNASSIIPFLAQGHSINIFTFTRSERLDVENILHSYFSVNQQNSIKFDFASENTYASFFYSPDSYLVSYFKQKIDFQFYTVYFIINFSYIRLQDMWKKFYIRQMVNSILYIYLIITI